MLPLLWRALILLCEFFLGRPLRARFLGGKKAGAISDRIARFITPYKKGYRAKLDRNNQWDAKWNLRMFRSDKTKSSLQKKKENDVTTEVEIGTARSLLRKPKQSRGSSSCRMSQRERRWWGSPFWATGTGSTRSWGASKRGKPPATTTLAFSFSGSKPLHSWPPCCGTCPRRPTRWESLTTSSGGSPTSPYPGSEPCWSSTHWWREWCDSSSPSASVCSAGTGPMASPSS